ncbi:MAG TPA: aldo/keto reductase, partial [Candidatus Faecousia gallistercoris]|nr:aldo/keto reductase [Candidatus Faecousia gallistercoris]
MIYREFQDLKLSALGMGCMRLPVQGGDDSRVDEEATAAMVDYAMAHGVNYYDTAWGYHGGHSETALGKALAKHPRDGFYLADKFPGYDLSNMGKVREIFEAQLKKCGVSYFDFYLFHNVCEMNIDAYLDPQYGILDYLLEQKKQGRIRHLGFSCHGNLPVLKRFLEAYGSHMEFCQLQLNYIDWTFQEGKTKVELLEEYHIPVWVMEPLRGGRLARLTEQEAAPLQAMRPEESVPAWAFRFL